MSKLNSEIINGKNRTIDLWERLNNLEAIASEIDPNYKRSKDCFSLSEYYMRNNKKDLIEIIRKLEIEYIDDTWYKADWAIVFIAGTVGTILDVLINQTNILKPIDKKIKEILDCKTVKSIQQKLDEFSNSFRNGSSAPIDFQDFEMAGPKSIHEIYSSGHDPIRFIEGIIQFITGNFNGIDKFGNLVNIPFGEPIPNIIHATISYVAHMLSDLLNKQGLPYPGTTFLMQFGSEQTRKDITTAFRAGLYNTRTAIYQSMPSFFISLIIHSYAIYDNYTVTKKINFSIGNNTKYQPMLLVANSIVALENISVTTVRGILGDPHAFFKVNWPIIANTIKHAFKYLLNENRKIHENQTRLNELEKKVSASIVSKSEEEFLSDLEKEFKEFCKE